MSAVVVVVFVVDVDRYPMTNGSHAQNRQNGTMKTNKHQTAQSGNSSPWSGLFQVYYIFQKCLFFIFLFPKSARLVVFLLLWCLSALFWVFRPDTMADWQQQQQPYSWDWDACLSACLHPVCLGWRSDVVLFFLFWNILCALACTTPAPPLVPFEKDQNYEKEAAAVVFSSFPFPFLFFLVF